MKLRESDGIVLKAIYKGMDTRRKLTRHGPLLSYGTIYDNIRRLRKRKLIKVLKKMGERLPGEGGQTPDKLILTKKGMRLAELLIQGDKVLYS